MLILSSNIIITNQGANETQNLLKELKITNTQNNPDTKIIGLEKNKTKIAIEEIRKAKEWAYIKPYQQDKKILIIENGEKLSTEAQNSMLKTLEEPPEYLLIFIITNSTDSLLDTVKSRCNIIKKENKIQTENNFDLTLNSIYNKDLSESLDAIEKLIGDDDSRLNIVNFVKSLQIELSKNVSNFPISTFNVLNQTQTDLESTNISPKMSLYKLILDLKVTAK